MLTGSDLPIYVINTPLRTDRKAYMTHQLLALPEGFSVEFVNGVVGKELTPEQLSSSYSPDVAMQWRGRELSVSEIGCALSHRSVLERMLDGGHPFAVVLEDDMAIGEDFPDVALALSRTLRPDRPRLVLLADFFVPSLWQRPLWGRYRLGRAWQARCGGAYLVTRATAQSLHRAQSPIRFAADWWSLMEEADILRVLGVSPGCVYLGLPNRSSGIGGDRAQPRPALRTRVRRKLETLQFRVRSWEI